MVLPSFQRKVPQAKPRGLGGAENPIRLGVRCTSERTQCHGISSPDPNSTELPSSSRFPKTRFRRTKRDAERGLHRSYPDWFSRGSVSPAQAVGFLECPLRADDQRCPLRHPSVPWWVLRPERNRPGEPAGPRRLSEQAGYWEWNCGCDQPAIGTIVTTTKPAVHDVKSSGHSNSARHRGDAPLPAQRRAAAGALASPPITWRGVGPGGGTAVRSRTQCGCARSNFAGIDDLFEGIGLRPGVHPRPTPSASVPLRGLSPSSPLSYPIPDTKLIIPCPQLRTRGCH